MLNLLGRFFQFGFIARDLDAATAMFAQRYGVRQFRRRRSTEWMDAAHAWSGNVMIELMVLESGAPAFYAEPEPGAADEVRLHHHGYMVEDEAHWAALECSVAEAGHDVPLSGTLMQGDFRFMYVDTRRDLGLYSEFIFQTGSAIDRYHDVPRN